MLLVICHINVICPSVPEAQQNLVFGELFLFLFLSFFSGLFRHGLHRQRGGFRYWEVHR